MSAHLIPFALGLGTSLQEGALLSSIFGGAGLVGSFFGGVIADRIGRARFANAIGLFSITTMPFGMLLPLLAGAMYDLTGSYREVFLLHAGLFVMIGTTSCFVYRVEIARTGTAARGLVAST